MECDAVWEELVEQFVPKSRKYPKPYTYELPSTEILRINFSTPQEIENYLIKHALSLGYCQNQGRLFERKLEAKGGSFRYRFYCTAIKLGRKCSAMMEYRDKEGILSLTKFRSQHIHRIKLTPFKAKKEMINKYITDAAPDGNLSKHVDYLQRTFKLSDGAINSIKRKIFWQVNSEEHLLQRLKERKITFRRCEVHEIFLICTETMRKNYQRYGDLACFDITYKLLHRRKDHSKHLGVGFFVGQDENFRIVLFGMCTIVKESSENFKKLFAYFYEVNNNKVPQTWLTDDQRAIATAFQMLKDEQGYQYHHLLDWYHKMQNVKRKIRSEHQKPILFSLFWRLMKETSKAICNQIIKQIAGFLSHPQVMIDFLKDRDKYCWEQVPSTFIGFGLSTVRAESMNNLIKHSVSHQTNIGKLVFCVLNIEKKMISRMENLYQINPELVRNVQDEEVLELQYYMEHLAYEQIKKNHEVSLELNQLIAIDETTVQVSYEKYDRRYAFTVKFDLARNFWVCECKSIYKTGIPCTHLMKVIRKFGGLVGFYINERWFHAKGEGTNIIYKYPPIMKKIRNI